MKRRVLSLLSLTAVLTLSLNSCTIEVNDGLGETVVTPGVTDLEGIISKDTVFKKGNYKLKGVVKVMNGATLTIEAGATFTVDTSVTSGLVVLQDGKINAVGTAAEPIVFTTATKMPGDWGGITLYGSAPIKAVNGNTSALSEDGNNVKYGGNDAASNSGVMKFVRVEYAGKKIGDGTSETNSMTFYAVGTGTVLENLVTYKGTDDGYEFLEVL